MDNKFRILIASYNNSEWVDYNISSVMNQTYKNYEVYYIDDHSPDDCKTFSKVIDVVGGDERFKVFRNETHMGGTYNHMHYATLNLEDDNTILCLLDGDDWFYDITVLEKLNEFYNRFDVWMTYGGMIVQTDNGFVEANPHNSPYSDVVHRMKAYREDSWRASHLRTYRAFLWKSVDIKDMYEIGTDTYYNHAADLALQFPCLEMCPKDKIGVVPFQTYAYNATQRNTIRTSQRQMDTRNFFIESQIRNRKRYREGIGSGKFTQVNVIGYDTLKGYTPIDFTYVNNLYDGEFDITQITDFEIPKFIKGEFKLPNSKVVADLHESREYSDEMNEIYDLVFDNHHMFDRILTYDQKLLSLPNSKLRFIMAKTFLSNEHATTEEHIQVYEKTKNISCVSSNKSFLKGHQLRLEMINHLLSNETKDYFDMFGHGFQSIDTKLLALKDYRFSISIENAYIPNYASEKISDCFLTGTIPIYYGCPNIGDYFDMGGIITFSTKEELQDIMVHLHINGVEEYQKRKDAVYNNFITAKKYALSPNEHFQAYLKDML